ncbi:MAG: cysteine desulfurase [Clostridia bacterium]|nr:cysteine desulfurase [Clostridia bacterium]
MENKTIYLDYAATTPMSTEVYMKMLDVFSKHYGNSSALYKMGRDADAVLEEAREKVAAAIGADPEEIYFTSGGTEANNWAITGIAKANLKKGNHIITSAIEHPSVIETCKKLEQEGFNVTYIPVDANGVIDYASIIKAMGPKTTLISIMTANNEVGSLQPIRAIAALASASGIYFHTDAVQAIGSLAIDVKELNVDALSLSAHKFYGPKGVGALYIKKGTKIDKFMNGGRQENNFRAGTLNVALCAGLGVAIENATTDLENKIKNVRIVRKYFQKKLSEAVHNISLNGHPTQRLPGNCSITFEGAESEAVVMLLDSMGVCASSGSACEAGSNKPSHVLAAMGRDLEQIRTTIRFTFGEGITKDDCDEAVELIRKAVKKIRSVSAIRIYKNKVDL